MRRCAGRLQRQQEPLARKTAGVAGQRTVLSDHAVAGDDDRQRASLLAAPPGIAAQRVRRVLEVDPADGRSRRARQRGARPPGRRARLRRSDGPRRPRGAIRRPRSSARERAPAGSESTHGTRLARRARRGGRTRIARAAVCARCRWAGSRRQWSSHRRRTLRRSERHAPRGRCSRRPDRAPRHVVSRSAIGCLAVFGRGSPMEIVFRKPRRQVFIAELAG